MKLWRKAGREVSDFLRLWRTQLMQRQADFKRAASMTPISGSIEDFCISDDGGLVAIVGVDSVLVYRLLPSTPNGISICILYCDTQS